MMFRLVLYPLLLLLAVVVVGVQLDRQTLDSPALAPALPAPFRAVAQQRLLELNLAGEGAEARLEMARALLRKRPVPARNLIIFAMAAQDAGKTPATYRALEAAAVRGWREPIPQLATAQAGLLSGDYSAAVQRTMALVATGFAPDETDTILRALIGTEGGRIAIADFLHGEGHWKRFIIRRIASLSDADQFKDIVTRAGAGGAHMDCAQLAQAFEKFGPAWQTGSPPPDLAALDCQNPDQS